MHTKTVLIARLADRVDRLRDTLTALRSAVRDKVAEVVGAAVQDVVRDAIRAALDRPAPSPAPAATGRYDDEDDWDDGGYGYRPYHPGGYPEVSRQPIPSSPPPAPAARLTLALAAGTRAATWWWGRTPNQKNWAWILVVYCT